MMETLTVEVFEVDIYLSWLRLYAVTLNTNPLWSPLGKEGPLSDHCGDTQLKRPWAGGSKSSDGVERLVCYFGVRRSM